MVTDTNQYFKHIRFSGFLTCMVLAGIVFILYSQVMENDFVFWDDPKYIYENPHVNTGITWENIKWAFTKTYSANWHSLTWISHMLDVELFGLDPAGHHMVNVLFHALNTVILFVLLKKLTGNFWPAVTAALLFAVHPLRVESVAWASERKDVLSAMFWMLSLLAYTRYVKRPGVLRYLSVIILLALGLMAKPMLITLPFVLLLLDFWPLNRWIRSQKWYPGSDIKPFTVRQLIIEKLPLLALSAAAALLTFMAQKTGGAVSTLESLPVTARLVTVPIAYITYLWKTLWPSGLACMYPHPLIIAPDSLVNMLPSTLGAALLLVFVTVLVIMKAPKRPYLAMGWFWYVVTLAPVSGIVQVGVQAWADRYSYIPLVGIYILIAWGVQDVIAHRATVKKIVIPVACVILAVFMTVTFFQILTWANSSVLFERALRVTSDNYVIHNNYGCWFLDQGDYERAETQFQRAIQIKPDVFLYNNLGHVCMKQGKQTMAEIYLKQALSIDPHYARALNNLGVLFDQRGDLNRALDYFNRALEADPGNAEINRNLGTLFERKGDLENAAGHYSRAVLIDPDYADAHNKLGMVYLKTENPELARTSIETAIRIEPRNSNYWNNIGMVYKELGNLKAAADSFKRAMELDPADTMALNNTGVVLEQQGDLDQAVAYFERAVRMDPSNVVAHSNLGNIFARMGSWKKAAHHFEEVLSITPDNNAVKLKLTIVRQKLSGED